MRAERLPLYEQLERDRQSKLIVYVTGDRGGMETQIHSEALDHLVHHLDAIGVTKKISLYLYTRGGSTQASYGIVNLLRMFCDELEVIVPSKAHSGGTLICLGADRIVMTKQATLGPIDPSANTLLNPQVPGQPGAITRAPVSVEAINGFVSFVRESLGEQGLSGMPAILAQLAGQVHPLVLGDAYRIRAQIRMLGRKLISRQLSDEKKIEKVLHFLCSESGSHDYMIFRREARNDLELCVDRPDDAGYKLIKSIYDDIAKELDLSTRFDPAVVLGTQQTAQYVCRRSLIESIHTATHAFVTTGTLKRSGPAAAAMPVGMPFALAPNAIQDDRTFEGWRHEP